MRTRPAPARDSAHMHSRTATRIGLGGAVALSALFILLFLSAAALRLTYPFELEWNEGAVLCHSLQILKGREIYVHPSAGFFPFNYPPLYFHAVALLARGLGLHFWVGRLVSLGSTLGTGLLLFFLVRRETGDGRFGLLGAGLFLSAYFRTGMWFDLCRVDSLALFLLLGAFWILRVFPGMRGSLLGALALCLATLTKQNFLLFLAGGVLFAATVVDFRHGLLFALSYGLLLAGGILYFSLRTGGLFWTYAFSTVASHGFHLLDGLRYLLSACPRIFPFFTAATLLAALQLGRTLRMRGGRPAAGLAWTWPTLAALAAWYIVRSHEGAWSNDAVPFVLFSSVTAPVIWCRLLERNGRWRRGLWWALTLLLFFQFFQMRYNPVRCVPEEGDARAGLSLLSRLRSIDGPVLMLYHPFYPVLAGKEESAHLDAFTNQYGRGRRARMNLPLPEDLVENLNEKRYAAVILDAPDNLSMDVQTLSDLIRKNYRLSERLFPAGDRTFYTVAGWSVRPDFLYVPKGEGK